MFLFCKMWPFHHNHIFILLLLVFTVIRISSLSNNHTEHFTKLGNEQNERKAIVGGIFSPVYRYSYIVTLQYSSSSGGTYHSCGGSLVAPDIVLSAAHCYKEYRGAPIVIIGDHDFDNPNDGGEQFDSEVLSIHPNWDKRLIREDIMLFKIFGTSTKTPVRLNREFEVPINSQTLTAVGWGRINDNDRTSVLKEATLEYITNKRCYGIRENAHRSIICTKDLDGVADEGICYGDSGGPLIIKGSNSSDDIQVGIVSKLYPPCTAPHVDMFTRISEYYDWIRDHICESSSSPPSEYKCQTVSPYPSISVSPSMQPSITSSPTLYKVRFTLVFRLDKYPGDIIWIIYEHKDTGGSYGGQVPIYSNMKGYPEDMKYDFAYETLYLEPDKKFAIFVYDLKNNGLSEGEEGYFFLYRGKEGIGYFEEKNLVLWRKGDYDNYAGYSFNSTKSEITTTSPSLSPNQYGQFITVKIQLDDFPQEISWGISNLDYTKTYYAKPRGSYRVSARQVVSEVVYLPAPMPLRFYIYNEESNGLQGDSFLKVYEGLPSNETLLFEYSEDAFYRRQFDFQIKDITSMPSMSTTLLLPSHRPSDFSQLPSTGPSYSPSRTMEGSSPSSTTGSFRPSILPSSFPSTVKQNQALSKAIREPSSGYRKESGHHSLTFAICKVIASSIIFILGEFW